MSVAAMMTEKKSQFYSQVDAETDGRERHFSDLLSLIERLHRRMLDVLKAELDAGGPANLNAVQALLLHNIGDAELTAGELRSRGHYLGSNVSYNLKKLVELGYVHHERSTTDRRSVRVRLTNEGQNVRKLVADMYARQWEDLGNDTQFVRHDLEQMNEMLARLEGFWASQIPFNV